MAKTLTQQHAELVEMHSTTKNELATAAALIETLRADIAARDSHAAGLAETIKQQGDEIARITGELTSVTAARDSFQAKAGKLAAEVETVKAQMALTAIPSIAGTAPVNDAATAAEKPAEFTRKQIAAMSADEYKKNRKAIMEAMANLRIK